MADKHFNKWEIIMRVFRSIFLVALLVLSTSACSIRHVIEQDYPQYLVNNTGAANLPNTDKASEYFLTSNTQSHSYEFRAVATGYANLWIVEFGKMLDDSLQSADVQNAFGALQKVSDVSDDSRGLLIFDLQSYTFEDFGAHISLKISLSRLGQVVFSKTYKQDGKTQGGKMFWAGAFGQKNAVQQSTKLALDEILRQLISDLNTMTGERISSEGEPRIYMPNKAN
ncbi:MAG: hypothetical protein KKA54_09985 [Proteobacteria bacterium]|nr:hypothetical protein [Pseudomonadota bacterium]